MNLAKYPLPTLGPRQQMGLASIAGDETARAQHYRDYLALAIENCVAKNLAKLPMALTPEQKQRVIDLINGYDPEDVL